MEADHLDPKLLVDGGVERLESRVLTFSIAEGSTDRNFFSHAECGKFDKYREKSDIKGECACKLCRNMEVDNDEKGTFLSLQMNKCGESRSGLLADKILDTMFQNSAFENQEMHRSKSCDRDLIHATPAGSDKERSFMGQQMAETGKSSTDLEYDCSEKENNKVGDLSVQQVAAPKECDAELPHCIGLGKSELTIFKKMENADKCVSDLHENSRDGNYKSTNFLCQQIAKPKDFDFEIPQCNEGKVNRKSESNAHHLQQGKYFFYDSPHHEETGVWIPISVPPMSASEHEEWAKVLSCNGGYFPEEDLCWSQYSGEDKELTMWDVVVEMFLVARGKVSGFATGDTRIPWISSCLIEQAWKEMTLTLTEANFSKTQEILEAEPPKWLPDSAASACMLCSVRFHPIMCSRHHCRFCGGIFCSECSKGRSLLPSKFRAGDPQRVCDVCCVRLESVQPYLMDQVSCAAQLPTHDLTDLSTLRSWVNFPWGQSMEYEIYKAANTIRTYNSKVGVLRPEKSIPDAILRRAKGLAILTVVKVGMMITYNIGTGLVVVRRGDGSWSAPSAISSFGVGWGIQAGGELADLIIVLGTNDAIKTFGCDAHVSVGAGLSAAAGIVGRTAGADLRAGIGSCAPCYTYSCSKGAFIGCSLEGSVVTTRTRENSRFYGSQSIKASDILRGSLPRPPAATVLYCALAELYQKLER